MKENKKTDDTRIEALAAKIAEPILTEAGYRLWDVVFEKEGAMWYLRVLFDKTDGEGITDEECENVTVPLNAAFDCQKFIENVDILEVGSPGLTRRLRLPEHFERYTGANIRCTVRGEKGKTEIVQGALTEYRNGEILLKTGTENEPVKIEMGKCIRINLDM